jgi:hypothetical protein
MLTRLYGVTLQKMVVFMFVDVEASNIALLEDNKLTINTVTNRQISSVENR